jgi:hypothetical protein
MMRKLVTVLVHSSALSALHSGLQLCDAHQSTTVILRIVQRAHSMVIQLYDLYLKRHKNITALSKLICPRAEGCLYLPIAF